MFDAALTLIHKKSAKEPDVHNQMKKRETVMCVQ